MRNTANDIERIERFGGRRAMLVADEGNYGCLSEWSLCWATMQGYGVLLVEWLAGGSWCKTKIARKNIRSLQFMT